LCRILAAMGETDPVTADTTGMLAEAWDALGGDAGDLRLVHLEGDPAGLLPSRLPAFAAMAAAISAATLAAAVLDGARSGRPAAEVMIGADHVALAARSERYARRLGSGESIGFAPLSRFWRASDRWIRLHGNYAWHERRALEVLGCDSRPESVAGAIASWRAEDLEEALAAHGALGFAVRDPAEWQRHAQGRAVLGQELVGRGAAPARGRRLGTGRGAAGVRVLDLTRVIAGPVATRTLAAWGADVLRIDSPRLPENAAQAIDTLPGKRSALVDFADPAGRARLEELLGSADVLVQGYRPGALSRFGLDEAELAGRHPHLSVVTLSAWGWRGPWAGRRGFDSLVQCPTGIAATEGSGGQPGVLPAQVLDHATGYLAAAAALLSLARVAGGEAPAHRRVSLARTAGGWPAGAPATGSPSAGPTRIPGSRRCPDPRTRCASSHRRGGRAACRRGGRGRPTSAATGLRSTAEKTCHSRDLRSGNDPIKRVRSPIRFTLCLRGSLGDLLVVATVLTVFWARVAWAMSGSAAMSSSTARSPSRRSRSRTWTTAAAAARSGRRGQPRG
jgi:hypothetical protein